MEVAVSLQRRPVLGRLVRQWCLSVGLDVPPSVVVGEDFRIYHRGVGTVLHRRTVIGDRVRIFHGVTVGRADPFTGVPEEQDLRFVLEDDVWLCVGSVVLGRSGTVTVGRGTVLAANAVLLGSTGAWEVWAGNPARKVGERGPVTSSRSTDR